MQRRRTFTVMAILLAVLVLGVGYAAVSAVTLTLNGRANVNANFDFTVEFDTTHTVLVDPASNVTTTPEGGTAHPICAGAYTDEENATMTVWFDKDHTSATALYKIDNKNATGGLAATLGVDVTAVSGANADYFTEPEYRLCVDSSCNTEFNTSSGKLAAGQSVYLEVTIELAKAPLNDIENATYSVELTATPAEAD